MRKLLLPVLIAFVSLAQAHASQEMANKLAPTIKEMALSSVNKLFSGDGLIRVKSTFDVGTTMDNLEAVLTENGMTVMNRIKHSQSAAKVGVSLNPTELLVFGNPKIGSPLMACQQSVAIDLPQKALVWEDENKQTWIGYNDPMYLKERHSIDGCDDVLTKVAKALAKLANTAAGNP